MILGDPLNAICRKIIFRGELLYSVIVETEKPRIGGGQPDGAVGCGERVEDPAGGELSLGQESFEMVLPFAWWRDFQIGREPRDAFRCRDPGFGGAARNDTVDTAAGKAVAMGKVSKLVVLPMG